MKTLAGIVLYNPDIERLRENIAAIAPQVDLLVFIDNASRNYDEIIKITHPNSIMIKNEKNLGSATALNQICQFALDNDYEWALTLDQDSVVAPNLIEVYKQVVASNQHLGIISCRIKDRNQKTVKEEEIIYDGEYIECCITSASFVCIKAWQEVGGFDDTMFIDDVDVDFCKAIWQGGWGIYKTNQTHIIHELGNTCIRVKMWGKVTGLHNHSPFRYYYISRNAIYETRKYYNFFLGLLKFFGKIRLITLVCRYEEHKFAKTINIVKGAWAGLTCPIWKPQKRVKGDENTAELEA